MRSIYILIFISCIFHLLTINFFPTNFEGMIGVGASFFNSDDKLLFLKIFFLGQYNSFAYSFFGAIINFLIPFINSDQSVRLLSSVSYIFLILGILNLNEYIFNKKIKVHYLFIIILHPIVWHYGHRMYVGLFSYSLSIYFFSLILITKNDIKKIIYYIALGIGIVIKPFNLILIPISFLLYVSKYRLSIKSISRLFFFLLSATIIPFLYYFFIYFKLGDLIVPNNQDLKIAIYSDDSARNISYVFSNLIFYIGYLQFITLPFTINFKFRHHKNFISLITFIILLLISLYIPSYLGSSAELDLGPLQRFIPLKLYLFIISFCCVLFLYQAIYLILKNDVKYVHRKKIICVFSFIIVYLICLSFIKGSQRYIIPVIPIYLMIFFYLNNLKLKFITYFILTIYIFVNLALIFNYFVIGKSSDQIRSFLVERDILFNTNPGVITPHIYHLYQNERNLNSNKTMYLEDIKYNVNFYKETNKIFKSSIKIFNIDINKYSVNYD